MGRGTAALKAAAKVCNARVAGAELGARRVSFDPKEIRPGEYHFAVGTAGSACLVLQTVLPPLLTATGPSRLVLEGGTHNPWAPPFDFLSKTFLPLVAKMGAQVTASLSRYGFYPAGGGQFVVDVIPVTRLQPLELLDRGQLLSSKGTALCSNLPAHVGRRQGRSPRQPGFHSAVDQAGHQHPDPSLDPLHRTGLLGCRQLGQIPL